MAVELFGMPKKSDEPWEKPAPKKAKHTKLTSASKAKAKATAKKAGRKYPSLVDNMNAAKAQKKKTGATKKKSAGTSKAKSAKAGAKRKTTTKKKTTAKKSAAKS